MRSFRQVDDRYPGALAMVGDLSPRGGGSNRRHKSHASGRDVDIFFYAEDEGGRPLFPKPGMLRFSGQGRAVAWSPPERGLRISDPLPDARLDTRRTWALVKALLSDPAVQVQWIFISEQVGSLLLHQAGMDGDDLSLVARAAELFHRPTDAQAHDDHMHVRVYCSVDDRWLGCVDRGPQRWWKKRWKSMTSAAPL